MAQGLDVHSPSGGGPAVLQAIPTWSATVSYSINDEVIRNDAGDLKIFTALAANLNSDPLLNPLDWQEVSENVGGLDDWNTVLGVGAISGGVSPILSTGDVFRIGDIAGNSIGYIAGSVKLAANGVGDALVLETASGSTYTAASGITITPGGLGLTVAGDLLMGTNDITYTIGGPFTSTTFGGFTMSLDWPGAVTAARVATLQDASGTIAYISDLYTDEQVDDRVAALIQDGTGLTWTYVDGSNTLTGNVGGLTVSEFTSTNISQWTNDSGYLTAVVLTDDRIPRGTGADIEDGTWENIVNAIRPVTTGSDIGDATHRVGTLWMSSIIDYAGELSFFNGTKTVLTIEASGEIGINQANPNRLFQITPVADTIVNAFGYDNAAGNEVVVIASTAGSGAGDGVINVSRSSLHGGGVGLNFPATGTCDIMFGSLAVGGNPALSQGEVRLLPATAATDIFSIRDVANTESIVQIGTLGESGSVSLFDKGSVLGVAEISLNAETGADGHIHTGGDFAFGNATPSAKVHITGNDDAFSGVAFLAESTSLNKIIDARNSQDIGFGGIAITGVGFVFYNDIVIDGTTDGLVLEDRTLGGSKRVYLDNGSLQLE